MKNYLNSQIKKRESFRPYGISLLTELENQIMKPSTPQDKIDYVAPFMLKIGFLKDEFLKLYPSAAHVDNSTRYQTVSKSDGLYFKLIQNIYEQFNVPLIINTSFNLDGEPIVCSPKDACKTFKKSSINKMVIGSYIVEKN
jgi:carbamoyltransferase